MVRIVLADDDAALRDLVARGLEKDGHNVVVAADGAGALEKIKSMGGFDLLISDVEMPGMDGISLMHAAREESPGLRIIMVSGFAEQLQRAQDAGVAGLRTLLKPFALDAIRAEVKAAMD